MRVYLDQIRHGPILLSQRNSRRERSRGDGAFRTAAAAMAKQRVSLLTLYREVLIIEPEFRGT